MQHQERIHALDAVRAFALLLGVFFHAAMSFIDVEAENLNWAIADSSQSNTLLLFVGLSHIFRMSLFFFIAGYFAHLVYHRKGAEEFALNRSVRILIPFVVGWFVIAPLLAVIWRWGQAKAGVPIVSELWPSLEQLRAGEIRLTHLWFLYYLALVYVLVVGFRHVFADRLDRSGELRVRVDKTLVTLTRGRIAPLVLSIPLALVAILATGWNAGQGMPTPDTSLIPEMIPLTGYTAVFAAGWIFRRTPALLSTLTTRVKSSFGLSFIALVAASACSAVLGMLPNVVPPLMRFLAALTMTSVMWYFNFGLIGVALKRFGNPSRTTRYVADASYWIYIAHLPVVCALQVLVAQWPIHWTIKYPFIVGVAFVLLFASYHLFVRYTFIGTVLNGRKLRSESENGIGREFGTVPNSEKAI